MLGVCYNHLRVHRLCATPFNEYYNKIIDVVNKSGSKQPQEETRKRFRKRELDYIR